MPDLCKGFRLHYQVILGAQLVGLQKHHHWSDCFLFQAGRMEVSGPIKVNQKIAIFRFDLEIEISVCDRN